MPGGLLSIIVRPLRLVVPVGRRQPQVSGSGPITNQRCRRRGPWARRARTLAMLATVASAAFVAAAVSSLSLWTCEAPLAGGENQRTVRGDGNGVLSVCAS